MTGYSSAFEGLYGANKMTEPILEGRATVEIELDREEWFQLMMMAHERDITLNQMVELVLRQAIEKHNESQSLSSL